MLTVPRAITDREVLVALRPGAIAVRAWADMDAAERPPNSMRATVEQVIYHGQSTHLYLQLEDGETLLAFRQNRAGERMPASLSRGAQVIACWSSQDNHVVIDR